MKKTLAVLSLIIVLVIGCLTLHAGLAEDQVACDDLCNHYVPWSGYETCFDGCMKFKMRKADNP